MTILSAQSRDKNEPAIVEALRRVGVLVYHLDRSAGVTL